LKVVWSPLAIEKLEAIAKFIALDKPTAAEKWVNDIFDRAEVLGSQP
jgi:toxin ParE1/3/4